MPEALVISLARKALTTVLLVAGPLLAAGLLTGLVVSIFQATTQINEQTMTFVPKIIAIFLAAMFFGPWMIRILVEFGREMLENLPSYIQ